MSEFKRFTQTIDESLVIYGLLDFLLNKNFSVMLEPTVDNLSYNINNNSIEIENPVFKTMDNFVIMYKHFLFSFEAKEINGIRSPTSVKIDFNDEHIIFPSMWDNVIEITEENILGDILFWEKDMLWVSVDKKPNEKELEYNGKLFFDDTLDIKFNINSITPYNKDFQISLKITEGSDKLLTCVNKSIDISIDQFISKLKADILKFHLMES
jgi:hypothetical protein